MLYINYSINKNFQLITFFIIFALQEKCLINRWALLAENFIHTKASGLDNTICTYGTMVQYTKLNSYKLLEAPELQILLIYSGMF